MGGVEGGDGGGAGAMAVPQGGMQQEQYLHVQGGEEATQAGFVQKSEQRVVPQPPKPLFDVPPTQLGGGAVSSHPSHGFDPGQEVEDDSGYEDPSYHQSSFEEHSHLGVGSGQGEGEEGFHQGEIPQEGHFFQPRGHFGGNHRGDFQPRIGKVFRGPRGRGVGPPRFNFRGPRPFGPRGERGPAPRHWERGGMKFQGHRGPTEEKFSRGGPRGENIPMFDEEEEESFSRNFPPEGQFGHPPERGPQHESYIHRLETVKKREQQKEMELRRELERMREIERKRKMEMEQKLEREKAEMERLKELELKRREEEMRARAREQELEKKREMDLQLTQEIENKRREMERMRERKQQMERELMEKEEELERRSTGGGGGGGGGGVGEAWNPPDVQFAGQVSGRDERADQATIPSWNTDPARIPGLGDFAEPAVARGDSQGDRQTPKPQLAPPTSQPQESSEGGVQATQMMESLGKIVSQLQTLQGLTSSLKLLRTLPKGKEGDGGSGGQGGPGEKTEGQGGGPEEVDMTAQREKELSEDTKRKVAALLANESDSDGEQVGKRGSSLQRLVRLLVSLCSSF